jgi:hypothetical protein
MPEPATFRGVINIGKSIVDRCKKIQPRTWGAEGAIIELVKQVGDLARHVMVFEGYYGQRDDQERYAADKQLITLPTHGRNFAHDEHGACVDLDIGAEALEFEVLRFSIETRRVMYRTDGAGKTGIR